MEAALDQETSALLKMQKALKDVQLALGQAKSCVQAVFAQGRRLHMSMILGLTLFSDFFCCKSVCIGTINVDNCAGDQARLGRTLKRRFCSIFELQ